MTVADVQYFFAHADSLTPEERHLSYYALPCKYSGSLAIGEMLYEFEINAGSLGIIFGKARKGTYAYACGDLAEHMQPDEFEDIDAALRKIMEVQGRVSKDDVPTHLPASHWWFEPW